MVVGACAHPASCAAATSATGFLPSPLPPLPPPLPSRPPSPPQFEPPPLPPEAPIQARAGRDRHEHGTRQQPAGLQGSLLCQQPVPLLLLLGAVLLQLGPEAEAW